MRMPGKLTAPRAIPRRRRLHAALALLAGMTISLPAFSTQPRTVLHIFKYGNSDSGQPAQRFDEFKGILQDKILLLAEELKQQGDAFNYVTQLQPHYVTDQSGGHVPFSGGLDTLEERWQQAHALEILSGRLFEQNGGYEVRSRIFLGDLGTDLGESSIRVDLPISDDQYDTTRDSHSVVILYGLAMDARQRCRPAAEVSTLLSVARESASDLPANLPGIAELKAAIDQGLAHPQSCTTVQP